MELSPALSTKLVRQDHGGVELHLRPYHAAPGRTLARLVAGWVVGSWATIVLLYFVGIPLVEHMEWWLVNDSVFLWRWFAAWSVLWFTVGLAIDGWRATVHTRVTLDTRAVEVRLPWRLRPLRFPLDALTECTWLTDPPALRLADPALGTIRVPLAGETEETVEVLADAIVRQAEHATDQGTPLDVPVALRQRVRVP